MCKAIKYSFIVSIFILSCKTRKINSSEEDYVKAYKKTVLYECINAATNGNLYKFSDENKDLGIATEVAIIYHSDAEHAKNIGVNLSKKIREINYSDYMDKKPIFSDCVDFAFGKYVDSIARIKYKHLKNSKLEYISE